ncbi:MAG: flagellar protein FliS [Planctomycetes bacterium]|nr:flagellar protein FliS [Planctomycetota bacterium]
MRPHDVYRQHNQAGMLRIDMIITLYRKAIDRLERAKALVAEKGPGSAGILLSETQVAISSLSAGLGDASDETSLNYLRLFEFVAHKISVGTVEDIEAAKKVLGIMLEGFVAVRDQAAAMELQGTIPPIDREHAVQVTA